MAKTQKTRKTKKTTKPRATKPRASKPRAKRVLRKNRDVSDMASLSVRKSLTNPANPTGLFIADNMYDLRNITLDGFQRAVTVASAYQHYRIKKVTLTLKPTYDTHTDAAGGNSNVQMYYMIDKSGSIPLNPTLEMLKQMGAKPIRFDEKPISVSWRPSVLTGEISLGGALVGSKYAISPWLSTSAAPFNAAWAPSQIEHLGIFFYAAQLFGDVQYQAEIEVQFQFKKPLITKITSSTPSVKVGLAVEDDSKDGIVGGSDEVYLKTTA